MGVFPGGGGGGGILFDMQKRLEHNMKSSYNLRFILKTMFNQNCNNARISYTLFF